MVQTLSRVIECREISGGIFTLRFHAPLIAAQAAPGQFVNLRCSGGCAPLLRRPFSISRVVGDTIELLFNVVGQGTALVSQKRAGDVIDVLGPLGSPFKIQGSYNTAILVGGGLGVAPLPFLTEALIRHEKAIETVVGARSAILLTERHLQNVHVATDDGTKGFHGTVVDLLKSLQPGQRWKHPKIFGCGPTRMMAALAEFARTEEIECELSLEGEMACGLGLCQGCVVERTDGIKKYSLVCIDGPAFNSKDIMVR
jgi:dihydroorotate dehydrogenase electron transfer subunit